MGCTPSKPANPYSKTSLPTSAGTYVAWSQAEENDEQDFLEQQKTALTVQSKLQAAHPDKFQAQEERKRNAQTKQGRTRPAPSARYTGPHLKEPWTIEQADALLDFYMHQVSSGKDHVHISYAEDVVAAGIDMFRQLPTVVRIPVPEAESSQTLIVVGDTHGQLSDVLYIFSVHGPPSAQNTYLFNGDIADRGPSACEIVLLLLTYKLACASSIYINRGNHENSDINERPAKNGGGFGAEVRAKYDRETFQLFQRFFCTLPLATVLGDECIVVHGGLCRLNPSLEAMSVVSREMQCPDNPQTTDETILFDSLWADPAADGEPAGAGRGGVCYSFDEVATTKFLVENGLSLVIRSHQLPPKQRGYMLHHSNKVLTVFSASNYCGICANHGSILILRGGMSEVWEYRAPPLETLLQTWEEVKAARAKERKKRALASATKSRSLLGIADVAAAQIRTNRWGGISKEKRVQIGRADEADASTTGAKRLAGKDLILSEYELADGKTAGGSAGMDVSVVRALKERICLKRGELLRVFHKADTRGSGLLALSKWRDLVTHVLGVPIDWELYSEQLVRVEQPAEHGGGEQMVDIVKSLDRYQIRLQEAYAGWQGTMLSSVYTKLRDSDLSLESLKARFDADSDGNVSASEVLQVLSSFDLSLARPQLERALLWMNMDDSSKFEASHFIAQLHVMCHDGSSSSERGAFAGEGKFDKVRLSDGSEMDGVRYISTVLTHIVDTDRDGVLSAQELQAVSQHLWQMIDTDKDGYLSYDEFANAVVKLIRDDVLKGHAHLRAAKGALTRDHALQMARRIDVCNLGHICFLDFLPLFQAVSASGGTLLQGSNSALIQHICTQIYQQQQALTKAFQFFDKDGDGRVEPEDFRSAIAMVGEVISNGDKSAEPFTAEQIEILARHCPLDNGEIHYNAFLNAFTVVDVASPADS